MILHVSTVYSVRAKKRCLPCMWSGKKNVTPPFSPVSVQVNLLNGFSAVAVTLCPVARCLWAWVDVA